MERVVVAGASIAILLVDEDPHAPYGRPSVSKGLPTGAQELSDIVAPWSEELALERVAGVRLEALDLEQRVVRGRSGARTR